MDNERQFSIKRTVNLAKETTQFPHFSKHSSLLGWCDMNYSKVLTNPRFAPKPNKEGNKRNSSTDFTLVKPFTKLLESKAKEKDVDIFSDFKLRSDYTLTTVPKEIKAQMIDEKEGKNIDYLTYFPPSCELGNLESDKFLRKVRQIEEITYEPNFKPENIRHFERLPNSILTEESLMSILNKRLEILNLRNHTWLPKTLLSKIGHLAPNLKEIGLSGLQIDDFILRELNSSCSHLEGIDISKCPNITTQVISEFIGNHKNLTKFVGANNPNSVTDAALENLRFCKYLQYLDVSFCSKLTEATFSAIAEAKCSMSHLLLATIKTISSTTLNNILKNSKNTLRVVEFSFLGVNCINEESMTIMGECNKLKKLTVTGCTHLGDDSINNLARSADNSKSLENLTHFKIGGLSRVSEHTLIKFSLIAPNIEFLELNGLEKLTDNGVNTLTKYLVKLETMLINLTPNVDSKTIEEITSKNPQLKIVRHTIKMTDPNDEGLRMPAVPMSKVLQPVKKGKKKKKK